MSKIRSQSRFCDFFVLGSGRNITKGNELNLKKSKLQPRKPKFEPEKILKCVLKKPEKKTNHRDLYKSLNYVHRIRKTEMVSDSNA